MIKSQTTKLISIHVDKDLKVQITSNLLEIFSQGLLRSLDLEVKEIMNSQNFGIQNLVG